MIEVISPIRSFRDLFFLLILIIVVDQISLYLHGRRFFKRDISDLDPSKFPIVLYGSVVEFNIILQHRPCFRIILFIQIELADYIAVFLVYDDFFYIWKSHQLYLDPFR